MISWKQWVVLFVAYLFYLLIGGAVFLRLEVDNEIQNERKLLQLQRKLSGIVLSIDEELLRGELEEALQELGSHIGEELLAAGIIQYTELRSGRRVVREVNAQNMSISSEDFDATTISELANANLQGDHLINDEEVEVDDNTNNLLDNDNDDEIGNITIMVYNKDGEVLINFPDVDVEGNLMWNLWNSFYFSFTAITTIGFGHLYPKTDSGQFFCILYSLFGVPFNGIVFAGLADLFASKLIKKVDSGRYKQKWKIVLDSCFYLVPGLAVLMVVPALIIMFFENWSFLGAFYFAFITLSTIGFGDYVAGYPDWMSGPGVWIYRVCIMAWICFGLGYLLMVIAFIQRALRSEEFRKIDRGMKKAFQTKIDATTSHIRTDLERIRRILITISKARTKESRKSSVEDIHEVSTKKDERATDDGDSQNREVTNVEILLELAETIIAAKTSDKSEEEQNALNHLSFGNPMKDNPAFEAENDAERGPSRMKRRFSSSLNVLRKMSIVKLPPPAEEPETHIHTLGDILDEVEDILQTDCAPFIVDNAEKKRVNSINSAVYRRNSDSTCDVVGEEPLYLNANKKRRYTLATLLARP